uniref:Calmodulin-lysine N-methyltransferase n=1 Tax=Oryza meridionalis TaxID=40149 RepID=A0A0E0CXW3_9ORYZ
MDSASPPYPPPAQASAAEASGASNASLRWRILRRALLARSASTSRAPGPHRFLPLLLSLLASAATYSIISHGDSSSRNENIVECHNDVCVCYKLPCEGSRKLNLVYRREDSLELNDIVASNRYNIDTTGLVCCWPSEEVLAYYCINHSDMFRSKKVLELGSGYGLAGLAIAASTDADEVVISDGNPQNISINTETFGQTKVNSMVLHWDVEQASEMNSSFDIIVASDCTFFKQFHQSLVRVVKSLLKPSETSQAIFLSPKRGDSLSKFLEVIKKNGLTCELIEKYDPTVWNMHKKYVSGDNRSWPNYNEEHCYPLLIRIINTQFYVLCYENDPAPARIASYLHRLIIES